MISVWPYFEPPSGPIETVLPEQIWYTPQSFSHVFMALAS